MAHVRQSSRTGAFFARLPILFVSTGLSLGLLLLDPKIGNCSPISNGDDLLLSTKERRTETGGSFLFYFFRRQARGGLPNPLAPYRYMYKCLRDRRF